MTDSIDISSETVNKLVPVFDGFWLAATTHHPGGAKSTPEINNRCLLFRLEEDGKPVLVVVNAVDLAVIPEIRRVEAETGLTVAHIVSPGGGHHLVLPKWHDEFTTALVHLCPIRAPRTTNCAELIKSERTKLLDLDNPLPQFAGQLDMVVFHGLLGFPDVKSPMEGAKENLVAGLKMMWMFMRGPNDPADELWLHHVPSGTVIAGENLGWMFTKDDYERLPGMWKKMMKTGEVYLPTAARKVSDANIVGAVWKKILAWPAKTLITFHDTAGFAWTDDPQGTLTRAVSAAGQA